MKLKEFEGKELFAAASIPLPSATLVTKDHAKDIKLAGNVLKAQILAGKRGKNGGILFPKTQEEGVEMLEDLLGKTILDEEVKEVLVEEKLEIKKELYLGILFDSKEKAPVLLFSEDGGADIEEIPQENIISKPIDVTQNIDEKYIQDLIPSLSKEVVEIIVKLYNCFKENDMKMVEINPLAITTSGKLYAADSVVVLDDNALKRHEFTFPQRSGNKQKTSREMRANAIDQEDHRGVCGSTFIDLPGNIGILSSGGGASITALDAIISYGGELANFTEYSGNPPAEKVKKLTEIVLEPERIQGLFIVGGRANFTRIDITLKAILDILIERKVKFPIVVRRVGPGYEEAFALFKEAAQKHGLDITLYDDSVPISVAAQKMVEEVQNYGNLA